MYHGAPHSQTHRSEIPWAESCCSGGVVGEPQPQTQLTHSVQWRVSTHTVPVLQKCGGTLQRGHALQPRMTVGKALQMRQLQ